MLWTWVWNISIPNCLNLDLGSQHGLPLGWHTAVDVLHSMFPVLLQFSSFCIFPYHLLPIESALIDTRPHEGREYANERYLGSQNSGKEKYLEELVYGMKFMEKRNTFSKEPQSLYNDQFFPFRKFSLSVFTTNLSHLAWKAMKQPWQHPPLPSAVLWTKEWGKKLVLWWVL